MSQSETVRRPLIYALTFVLAACSLLYELLIAQTVSLFAANNVIWYSLTTGLFIGCMGLGAFLSASFYPKKSMAARLVVLELSLSVAGGLSVLFIHGAQMVSAFLLLHNLVFFSNVVFFGIAFAAIVFVGILTGMELPILMDLATGTGKHEENSRILAMDYLGSLAGGFIFPIFLLPHLDVLSLGFCVALVNILMAALLLGYAWPAKGIRVVQVAACFLFFLLLLLNTGRLEHYFLSKYYFAYQDADSFAKFMLPYTGTDSVERIRTPYQAIDLVRWDYSHDPSVSALIDAYSHKYRKDTDQPRGLTLFLNGDFQFTSDFEDIYHETFAHVPVAATGKVPRKVLVMGGGDGLLVRELLKYKDLETIVQVEIDKDIVEVFKNRQELRRLNANSFESPRLCITFDDAYHYIKTSEEKFDAIYLDFPDPLDYNLTRLFTSEFYTFVRQHLNVGGFMVLDAPGLTDGLRVDGHDDYRAVYQTTIKAAGFSNVMSFMSRPEKNNDAARDAIRKRFTLQGVSQITDDLIDDSLEEYLAQLRAGFMAASDTPFLSESRLAVDKVTPECTFLNPQRIKLAFSLKFDSINDRRPVNSILRPKLPVMSDFWKVRTPY